MLRLTKIALGLNGASLLFVVLWLLLGGSGGGYWRSGAAGQVDGVLLMVLTLMNLIFIAVCFLRLSSVLKRPHEDDSLTGAMDHADASVKKAIPTQIRKFMKMVLSMNGILLLFIVLWLALISGRRQWFRSYATEVDVIVLLVLTLYNVCYMGLALLRFTSDARADKSKPQPTPEAETPGEPGPPAQT